MFFFICMSSCLGFMCGLFLFDFENRKLEKRNKLLETNYAKLADHILYLEGDESLGGTKLLPEPKKEYKNSLEELLDKLNIYLS